MKKMTIPQIASLPLALPCPAFLSVPRDRPVWVLANVVESDGICTTVDHFEGRAEWSESSRCWLDSRRRAISSDPSAEIFVREWEKLDVVAARAPAHETSLTANVYYWDNEWRREAGTVGYFALLSVSHSPTLVELRSECRGPFERRDEAMEALLGLLDCEAKRLELAMISERGAATAA